MKKENILLITLEYVPFKGGIARYMEGFVSMFPEDQITILVHDENEGRNGNVIRKNMNQIDKNCSQLEFGPINTSI